MAPDTTAGDDPSLSSGPGESTGATTTAPDSGQTEVGMSSGGDAPAQFLDCVPTFYNEPSECTTQAWNATVTESWSSFACGNCVCVESCENDGDCIDRGAPVPPRCMNMGTSDLRGCFLVCEDDQDCPTEMVCLPSNHLAEKACYVPWLKPECCEQGGPFC